VGALLVTVFTSQLSAVAGVPKVTPVAVQAVLVTVLILAGTVIVGGIISFSIFKDCTDSLPVTTGAVETTLIL
jgi:hypothetical protein